MKNEKDKVREPYTPEQTPNPPQIIDPSGRKERGEGDHPVEGKRKTVSEKPTEKSAEKPSKLPGESETEIEDETTI